MRLTSTWEKKNDNRPNDRMDHHDKEMEESTLETGPKTINRRQNTKLKSLISHQWWVFLLVGIGDGTNNKTTEIRMHRHPEAVMLGANACKHRNQSMWTIVMRVGPFYCNRKAVEFHHYWNTKSRGFASRISKGIHLTGKYHRKERVKLYVTSHSKLQRKLYYKNNGSNFNSVSHKLIKDECSSNKEVIAPCSSLKLIFPTLTLREATQKYSPYLKKS